MKNQNKILHIEEHRTPSSTISWETVFRVSIKNTTSNEFADFCGYYRAGLNHQQSAKCRAISQITKCSVNTAENWIKGVTRPSHAALVRFYQYVDASFESPEEFIALYGQFLRRPLSTICARAAQFEEVQNALKRR